MVGHVDTRKGRGVSWEGTNFGRKDGIREGATAGDSTFAQGSEKSCALAGGKKSVGIVKGRERGYALSSAGKG